MNRRPDNSAIILRNPSPCTRALSYLLLGALFVGVAPSVFSQDHTLRLSDAPIAIEHVTLVPMTGDAVLRDQTVIIAGKKISKIEGTSKSPAPHAAKTIDGTGMYLIPGLIDCHVHLYAPQHLELYLANGVTTVFNLNGRPLHLLWRDEVASGKRLGPRIYTVAPKFDHADSPERAAELVEQYWKSGYDGIKIYNQVSKAEYPVLIAAARKHRMLIVGHIAREPGFEATLKAGQAIAHAEEYLYTFFEEHNPGGPPDPKLIPQAVAETKASGVPVIATLVTYEHILEQATNFPAFLQRPEMHFWAPWELADIKDAGQNPYLNFGPDDVDELKRNYPFQKILVRQLHDAGVIVLGGTDSGSIISVPGFALHEELANLVQSGFSPIDALRSVTIEAARFLKGDREFGTIEIGKSADLVLLRANPLDNIENTRLIAGVVVRGQWLSRSDIDHILQAIPDSYDDDEHQAEEKFAHEPSQAVSFLKKIDPFFDLGGAIISKIAFRDGPAVVEHIVKMSTQSDPESPLDTPDLLNDIGDSLLASHRNEDAIEIFRFNIAEHPKSAIAYDRLARAYNKLGQYELSRKFYKQALDVDATYWNAETARKRISELTKKLQSNN